MLAHVRRGPLAPPTKEEQIQYLLTSRRRDADRILNSNYYAMEHVISYQRRIVLQVMRHPLPVANHPHPCIAQNELRIQATKQNFLQRGKRTPLGVLKDWWDRLPVETDVASI